MQLLKEDRVFASNLCQEPSASSVTNSIRDVHLELDVFIYHNFDYLTARSAHYGLQCGTLSLLEAQ